MSNSRKTTEPYEVPLFTELIDGKKRQVGVAKITPKPDGTYNMETKIMDPEAIAMIQDPDLKISLPE